MKDSRGRVIDYMRISVTDRCDLRCAYCMPQPIDNIPHADILRYEEILILCGIAVELGIVNFKVTGGEPFVRPGAVDFIRSLKALPGVNTVTVTTNGMLPQEYIAALSVIPIDGINISLDASEPALYKKITGRGDVARVKSAIKKAADLGMRIKTNTVLLDENQNEWLKITEFAQRVGAEARFIELMPIGSARGITGPKVDELKKILKMQYGSLMPFEQKIGNGPAKYFTAPGLKHCIGIIGAATEVFCGGCNRVRLTSEGVLKPCLCYDSGTDLRKLLRGGAGDAEISATMQKAIYGKPSRHCFDGDADITEQKSMNRIGG